MCKRLFVLSFLSLAAGMLFSIITLISPNGGETWTPGYSHHITWSWSVNETGNVMIDLWRNTTQVAVIASSTPINDGQIYWTSPITITPGSNYFVQIRSLNNTSVYDVSDAQFTFGPAPTITVVSPNGGETWNTGGTYPITWNSTNLTGNLNITVLIGTSGNYSTLSTGTAASAGVYNWTIPNTLLPGSNNFKVRIYSLTVPAVRDTSNNFFSIIQPINITSPAGGEVWLTGSTHVITWTATNITGSALIELYQGTNSTPTSTIVSSTVMSYGNRVWTIPTNITPANNYKIKISSLSSPTIYDYSVYFTISNEVAIDDPLVTPLVTALEEVFPNPFKKDTTIKYSVKETGNLSLEIYDVKGRLVRRLINSKSASGTFSTIWNGTDESGNQLSNGIYYLQMKTGTYQTTRKLVLLR